MREESPKRARAKFSLDAKDQVSYAEGIRIPEVRMPLSCQKAFVLTLALTMACHESTAPPSTTGVYVLESINSQAPPTNIFVGAEDTTTVFWSTLTFDAAGHAVLVERMRHAHPYGATEGTYTTGYSYRLSGDRIVFDYSPPCPPNALCIEPPVGTIVDSKLILSYGSPAFRPSSVYRLTTRID